MMHAGVVDCRYILHCSCVLSKWMPTYSLAVSKLLFSIHGAVMRAEQTLRIEDMTFYMTESVSQGIDNRVLEKGLETLLCRP